MATRRSAVLAGAAVVLAVAGCADSCTLIGCANTVSVVVDQAGERPLEACVEAQVLEPRVGGRRLL